MAGRRLISSDEAVPAKGQHTSPCSDCPFARASLPGWLGGETVENWLQDAHGEGIIPCHVLAGAQCAGAAIYRRNVLKRPRDPEVLVLGADRVTVFATPPEFAAHHESRGRVPGTTGGGSPPEEGVTMPKAEVIAANLKIGTIKAEAAAKLTAVKDKAAKACVETCPPK